MASGDESLTTQQAAEFLGLSVSSLEKMRAAGNGPPFFKPTRQILRYRRADLDAWIAARTFRSTAEVAVRREAEGGADAAA